MSKKDKNKALRELLDIEVNEVSLVDFPAIEEEFAVIKRNEEKAKIQKAEDPKAEDPKAEEDKETEEEEEVAKVEDAESDTKTDVEASDDKNDKSTEETKTDVSTHRKMFDEKLEVLRALLDKIKASIDSVDLKTLRENLYAMQDITWSIEREAKIINLAKRAEAAIKSGDVAGAAKLLKEASEAAEDDGEDKDEEKKFSKTVVARIRKAFEAMVKFTKSLQEVQAESLLKAMGEGEEEEEEEGDDDKDKEKKDPVETKNEIDEDIKKELAKLQQEAQSLRSELKKRDREVPAPQGRTNEGTGASVEAETMWPRDLAAQ